MKQVYSLLICMFVLCIGLVAQNVTINGTVTPSVNGDALSGVNVSYQTNSNQKSGAVTNAFGQFTLNVPSTVKELIFSYVGKETMTEKINGRRVINIKLAAQSAELDRVVVTALGIKREGRALSYSQQGIDVAALNETKSTNLINSLSGKIAGLQVVPPGFNTGSARVIIRGNNSLTGNNQPLFVVLINSWNNFQVGTSIEPAKEYGTTYLEITKKEFKIK